jgi:hypothetical protein
MIVHMHVSCVVPAIVAEATLCVAREPFWALYFFFRECTRVPMFWQNVDSFPFHQISGTQYVPFLATVMPKKN